MHEDRKLHIAIKARYNILQGEYIKIEIEREVDGRWVAEIPDLPGVMVYGIAGTKPFQRRKH